MSPPRDAAKWGRNQSLRIVFFRWQGPGIDQHHEGAKAGCIQRAGQTCQGGCDGQERALGG
ncbi:hypothetical protein G039_0327115 [Pseudomonas aeruginosa VRFPA01]|nr:hypothetical protein G039_0327115 [Pseudomonas aeruginosa VRFPA01]